MACLVIDGISCAYAADPVLQDVSLTVGPGERIGILGPNGSGKSTLLRAASRVLRPLLGRVLLDDHNLYELSPQESAQSMAVVPQETLVDFDFSCYEVVLIGRSPHLRRWQNERSQDHHIAQAAMQRTRTWSLKDRPFGSLSGGERQRVIVARAFAQEPRILLLDEPTSHLDVAAQIEILELVRHLCHEKGVAALCVLHDLNLAAHYCERIVLFSHGRIAAMGPTLNVLTPQRIREVFAVDAEVQAGFVRIKFPMNAL